MLFLVTVMFDFVSISQVEKAGYSATVKSLARKIVSEMTCNGVDCDKNPPELNSAQ